MLRLAVAAPQLAARISPELPDIVAEAAFAVGHEQARSLADVLLRRTRLGLLDARAPVGAGLRGRRSRAARADGRRAGLGRGAQREQELRELGRGRPAARGCVPAREASVAVA